MDSLSLFFLYVYIYNSLRFTRKRRSVYRVMTFSCGGKHHFRPIFSKMYKRFKYYLRKGKYLWYDAKLEAKSVWCFFLLPKHKFLDYLILGIIFRAFFVYVCHFYVLNDNEFSWRLFRILFDDKMCLSWSSSVRK